MVSHWAKTNIQHAAGLPMRLAVKASAEQAVSVMK